MTPENNIAVVQKMSSNVRLKCVEPDADLYKYDGTVTLTEGNQAFPVNADQLVLRGSQLRNTAWILGLAVYTGHETKEMQNVSEGEYKWSRLERTMNVVIAVMFAMQVIFSIVAASSASPTPSSSLASSLSPSSTTT